MTATALHGGMAYPATDRVCHGITSDTLSDLRAAIDLSCQRNVAFQAGGTAGVWAAELARHFAIVHTAEPDAENLACCRENVPDNVTVRGVALGHQKAQVGLRRFSHNCGAHYVNGPGDIEMITIDSLRLKALDLLVLDVEGYEGRALLGARKTIQRCRPVVMFEERGHGSRYGWMRGDAEAWLISEGYRVVHRLRHDLILEPDA